MVTCYTNEYNKQNLWDPELDILTLRCGFPEQEVVEHENDESDKCNPYQERTNTCTINATLNADPMGTLWAHVANSLKLPIK